MAQLEPLPIAQGKFGKTKSEFRFYTSDQFSQRELRVVASHLRENHRLQMGVPGCDERGFYLLIKRVQSPISRRHT
jgi:hypothetical protein